MKKKYIFIIIVLMAITSVQLWVTKDRTEQKKEMETADTHEEAAIGGGFTLTDQNGKTVHDTDFHGRIMLVSFGFTRCPDICPITVATLSKTMEMLGDKAGMVAPIFISVDATHDTPAIMKDFLSNFDKHLIGLTGNDVQIKQVADAYKVYYAKSAQGSQDDKKADYSIDHSGYIYMMAKDGQFMSVFPYNVPGEELAHAVEKALR